MPDEIRRQNERRDENTLIRYVKTHAACEYSVLRRTRTAAHDVALGLFHAERQRREAVCDEVYPQKMHGL